MAPVQRALRASCVVTAIAFLAVGPGALVAAGDDGPAKPFPADRPTRTILRPAEVPDLAPLAAPKPSAKEVIILVSGIGSAAPDATYDSIVKLFSKDPRYELHRFGGDVAYPYDTHGPLRASAEQLTAEVRELAKTHPAIHIVGHSMGGTVVDTAFANGLSARDKVVTYVSLAVPHNGSTEAAIGRGVLAVAGALGAATEFRAITAGVAQDIGSPAVADLAVVRSGPPPQGIARLDLRMATDLIVTAPDARALGVTSRTLLPSTIGAIEGHGGVATDPHALALIASTIEHRAPPKMGWRDRALQLAAEIVSITIARHAPTLSLAACVIGLCAAVGLAFYRRRRTPLIGILP